ncbi:MAG: hypothetical protein NDI61_09365 [Bdellovibrionaceae bacterium]|nr:hypothetical protein [Pseudobdellovibrionaceae bacterium]
MTRIPGPPTLFERLLRRFTTIVSMATLIPFYTLCLACIGLSLTPSVMFFHWVSERTAETAAWQRYLAQGSALGVCYLIYGLTLIFLVPAVNLLIGGRLRAWRGTYHSGMSIRWYMHNGLAYIVRFTFLEFITPTPLNQLYFQMMGMKVGRGTYINSSHISDPSLITLEEKVTIGGSAVIVGHYGVGGFLVLAPVVIRQGATIGLRATVMGGTEIGAGAKILPNSVVLPKTRVPAGETWGGVPAQKIDVRKLDSGEAAPPIAVGAE